jgi:GT2 family glycosyltransferase
MRASVIIPNLRSPHLPAVLSALGNQTLPAHEVIVVGQGGAAHVQGLDGARAIETPQPVIQAVARNMGAAQAGGEVLCFLDADCVPQPDWLHRLIAQHEAGEQVVGGSIALFAQPYWQLCDNIAHFGLRSQHSAGGEKSYLLAGNLSLRTDIFRSIGGFDAQFRYLEETDFGFRLRKLGCRLMFEPRAAVQHNNDEHNTAHAVWQHSHKYGMRWSQVAQAHAMLIGASRFLELSATMPPAAALLAPVLAASETRDIFVQREVRRQFARCTAGVWWSKLAWFAGIIAARGRTAPHTQ